MGGLSWERWVCDWLETLRGKFSNDLFSDDRLESGRVRSADGGAKRKRSKIDGVDGCGCGEATSGTRASGLVGWAREDASA